MEWLVCKACGSSAIIPMDVEVENVDLSTGEFDVSEIDEDGILDLEDDFADESDDLDVAGIESEDDDFPDEVVRDRPRDADEDKDHPDIEAEDFREDGHGRVPNDSQDGLFGFGLEQNGDDDFDGGEQESRFYSCHVCGDNWLAVKEHEPAGACQVTFIHQMGMAPVLKRVAHMQTHIVINESTVDNWEYYLDDERIEESTWLEKLEDRRQVLKSVASN